MNESPQQPPHAATGLPADTSIPASADDGRGPYALLDLLQEPMEKIALGEKENRGRFCGNCYAALTEAMRRKPSRLPAARCHVCGASTEDPPPVASVPAEVLAVYMAKRRREGLYVNAFAFVGIFLSLVLSAVSWLMLPANLWRVVPFAILLFGSYYLARLIGYDVGVPLGSRSGRRLRNRRWQQYASARRMPAAPSAAIRQEDEDGTE